MSERTKEQRGSTARGQTVTMVSANCDADGKQPKQSPNKTRKVIRARGLTTNRGTPWGT
jgi:hypothetical protein